MLKVDNRLFFILGGMLLLCFIPGYFFVRRWLQTTPPNVLTTSARLIETTDPVKLSPDEIAQTRLLRGVLVGYSPAKDEIDADIYFGWPKKDSPKQLRLSLTTNTELLCWPNKVRSATGTQLQLTDMSFFLGENQKLQLQPQTSFQRDQLAQMAKNNQEVVIALQQTYQLRSPNKVFQLAVIGCQNEK